jgi:uroporphyrinogen decarboxylase
MSEDQAGDRTSRERVLRALDHREPDRVPFDLGATVVTGIHRRAFEPLMARLGRLGPVPAPLQDAVQQIALVDESARDLLEVDACGVFTRTAVAPEVRETDTHFFFYDEWGVGWRMPKAGGLYFDMFHHPLQEAASPGDLKEYRWPDPLDPARFQGLAERARRAAEVEGRAVVLGGLCAGVLEMASWLRGFDRYYADIALNPDLLGAIMDRVVELKEAYWERALAEAGPYADVVMEADDFAGQHRLLISPASYRRLAKPRHKRLFDFIHARTRAKIFFHSCGAVRPAIPDLIEVGVDILNPVQLSAAGMDSAELKREFGREIVFWGGGVDTQRVLGRGTPAEVRDEVRRRIEDLAPGGGFIFAAVHNIQADVPVENIVAMREALREYGVYPAGGERRS